MTSPSWLGPLTALALALVGSAALLMSFGCEPQSSVSPPTQPDSPPAGPVLDTDTTVPPPSPAESKGTLSPDAVEKSEIAAGQAHSYKVELAAGDYFAAVALQRGVDLGARLLDPSNGEVVFVDSPNGREGPERIEILASETGVHRLELRSREHTIAGHYELRFETLRPALGDDRRRAQAAMAFARAEEERRRGKRPSLQRAVERYERSLVLWRGLGDASRVAATLQRLGEVYQELKALDEAQVSFERTLSLLEVLGEPDREAEALNGLGFVHFERRENSKAEELFREALELARSSGNRLAEAAALNSLAMLRQRQGQLSETLELFDQALEHWRALGNAKKEALTLNNLGSLHSRLQATELARSYFEQSLQLAQRIGDRRQEAVTLNNLGVLFYRTRQHQRAMDCFERVVALWEELEDPLRMVQAINNIGFIYRQRGDASVAQNAYRRALELARQMENRDVEAIALHNLGGLLDAQGDPIAALDFYAEAREHFDKLTLQRQITILRGMARALRNNGDLEAAQERIEAALNIARALRSKIADRSLRTAYFSTQHHLFEQYIDLLMERHQSDPGNSYETLAFEASQEARARGFLDLLSEAKVDAHRAADATSLAEERTLQERINANDHRHRALIDAGASTGELAGLVQEQRELLLLLDRVRTRIRLSRPQSIAWTEPLRLDEIRGRIVDRETLLLHYELAAERSFLWAVTSGSVRVFELPGEDEIEPIAADAARFLAQSHQRAFQGSARRAAALLSRTILAPVEELLGRKRLVIVGEGALEYVPFAALPTPSTLGAERPTLLVARHEIVRLPAASILAALRRKTDPPLPRRGWVAVLADPVFRADDPRVRGDRNPRERASVPVARDADEAAGLDDFDRLPASRTESEMILRWIPPGKAFLALGFQASRATVIGGELRGYPIIHFATHGVVDPSQPELSGIVLSLVDEHGQRQDGFLRAHEIYNLDLPVELIVVSACQTALGKELDGEGLVGLTQAFMYAGAKRLLVSLWRISDQATAELMGHFYREMLVEGCGPAQALRRAQLALLREERWQAPYYWAGFVLLGDWRSPVDS